MNAAPPKDRPAVPAEREALDRHWRLGATIAIGLFVLVSILLGFVIVPQSAAPGFDPLAAICRSIGIPGFQRFDAPPQPTPTPASPVSQVTWTAASRQLLAQADARQGAETAGQVCVACHGRDGIGIAPGYPNLTHQSAAAIYKQLQDYKSGARSGGMAVVMVPMAMGLGEQQMANVAAYYASLAPPGIPDRAKQAAPQIVQLVKIGSPARAMPPCDSCHGVTMSGPEETPVLLGQAPEYFEQQLAAFASGERRNDTYGRMRIIAQALTPQEVQGLAAYYAPLQDTQARHAGRR